MIVDIEEKIQKLEHYKLIKMMSVKTHGGKTIRLEVTQHTQKILQKKNFFPVKAKKYILGSRPYTLKKL